MPTEPTANQPVAGGEDSPAAISLPDTRSEQALAQATLARAALRLGIGVTLTFVIALAYDWTLAYLVPERETTFVTSVWTVTY